ncbi:MAG: 50S ribosomal protein L4 [Patescibacteria group bacterium]|jgi:large subunit ribosomal protein L4
MAEVKVYNWQGKDAGMMTLPDALFAVPANSNVIHDVIVAQDANSRVVLSHTKDRSQVSGGGKKPWKQKGTGRARHGSSRSPIWIGGGVTHGPLAERNFSVKLNKKMKRAALAMVLSDKLQDGAFVAVEDFSFPEAKTKFAAQMREALPGAKGTALVVVAKGDSVARRAVQNLPWTVVIQAHSLNVRDAAKYRTILASKAAIETMIKTFTV